MSGANNKSAVIAVGDAKADAGDAKSGKGDKHKHKMKGDKPKKAGSDDESVDPVLAAALAKAEHECSGCPAPCDSHADYPTGLTKKIDRGSFVGSVKAYSIHFVCCTGTAGSKWPNRVEDEAGSFAAAFYTAFEPIRKKVPFSMLMTLSDDVSEGVDPNEYESVADVLVFPHMIRYRKVRTGAQLSALLHAECMERRRAAEHGLKAEPIVASHVVLVCNHKLRDDRCGIAGPILINSFQHAFADKKLDGDSITVTVPRTAATATTATAAAPADAKSTAPTAAASDSPHVVRLTSTSVAVGGPQAIVMGTSHVGGHKWAGNILCYPSGRWYARVTPHHVPAIVQHEIVNPANAAKLQPLLRGCITPLPAAPATATATAAAGVKW